MATTSAQEEPGCEPEPPTTMTTVTVPAPSTEQVTTPLIPQQPTLNCMIETPEQDPETPAGQDLECAPEPTIQQTPEFVPDTPQVFVPETQLQQMEENPSEEAIVPEPMIQQTQQCDADTKENLWCVPESQIKTAESVNETEELKGARYPCQA